MRLRLGGTQENLLIEWGERSHLRFLVWVLLIGNRDDGQMMDMDSVRDQQNRRTG